MIYRLTGQVQHYAWGGKNYIASLIGLNSAKDQPCAEWWLGAHPLAPSEIENVTGKQSLIEFLSQNPTALGQASHQQFGDELPYLLKILDVEKPLSNKAVHHQIVDGLPVLVRSDFAIKIQ